MSQTSLKQWNKNENNFVLPHTTRSSNETKKKKEINTVRLQIKQYQKRSELMH